VEYDASGEFHTGAEAAALVGATPETVYKTLVILRDGTRGKPLLLMLPVVDEADLKALAAGLGEKSLRMATQREAEKLTACRWAGYRRWHCDAPTRSKW
jgi:Cys-tRNA(Pro)/Cys-tRNA(Cys) deacylase